MNKEKLEILKNKFIIKFKKDNMISYIILVLIALFICCPLVKKGFFITHDGTAHFSRNFATIQGLKAGQFPPTIISNFCGGYGYSWNLFYPPISTYINAFFYLIVQNYIIAMKLTIIFSVVFSSIFMFKFIQDVTQNKNMSLVVAIIYVTSIYFITDIYVRMAMGEIMVYMFLPLLFWGLYNIFYQDGKKNYLLTVGAVGILLSHNISSLIVVILSICFILLYLKKLFKSENRLRIWKNLFINAIFIILIVLFFYVPLLEHKLATEYVAMSKEGMSTKEFVADHAIYLYQLVLDKFGYGVSSPLSEGIGNEMSFSLGLSIFIPLLFTPICYRKIKKEKRLIYLSALILGITTGFMATKWFPWKKMPDIFILIQFPWRMLLFSTFLLSIIAGINICKCIKHFYKLFIILLIMVIYSSIYLFSIIIFDENYDISYMYETENIENIYVFSQQSTNHEYLPKKAKTTYIQDRENGVIVLDGKAQIINQVKEKNNMQFIIEENSEKSILELPYIYYLGYNIKLNGKEIKYEESNHGFISISIPKDEKGIVNVKYTGTKLSKMSMTISIIGIIGFVIYVNIQRKK